MVKLGNAKSGFVLGSRGKWIEFFNGSIEYLEAEIRSLSYIDNLTSGILVKEVFPGLSEVSISEMLKNLTVFC